MTRTPLVASAALLIGLVAAPTPASACGGFFCNRQGIDQSGENILFSINADGTVTTTVQIQYTGPSETFAWILPVPAEPTVGVGTDTIFRELAASTTPRFELERRTEGTCREEPRCYDDDWLEAAGGGSDASAGASDAGQAQPPGVNVSFRGNVGPYDVAVLSAEDPNALRDWLTDNDYLIPEVAAAELDHYVALDHYFVALKLQKDRDTGEIQPITLTSENNEPCIPIRLTRIATVPNMPITAYFLAEQRYRPLNFMLVNPDLDQAGLWVGGVRYVDVVSQSVDDAGGHAFVTDYAGDVPDISLAIEPLNHLRAIRDPAAMVRAIQATGLNGDSQLLAILTRHIPPPDGVEASQFFNCIVNDWCDSYTEHLDGLTFDPLALVANLDEAIVQPRARAQQMLDDHSHLTRLFTTMSADEMDEDPMFRVSAELPREHSRVHTATMTLHCGPEYFRWSAPRSLELPSGRIERVEDGVPYRGSDSEYCEDRRGSGFGPGMDPERAREIARARDNRLRGGGGRCAITPGATGLTAPLALAFGMMAFVWRRRR